MFAFLLNNEYWIFTAVTGLISIFYNNNNNGYLQLELTLKCRFTLNKMTKCNLCEHNLISINKKDLIEYQINVFL